MAPHKKSYRWVVIPPESEPALPSMVFVSQPEASTPQVNLGNVLGNNE